MLISLSETADIANNRIDLFALSRFVRKTVAGTFCTYNYSFIFLFTTVILSLNLESVTATTSPVIIAIINGFIFFHVISLVHIVVGKKIYHTLTNALKKILFFSTL